MRFHSISSRIRAEFALMALFSCSAHAGARTCTKIEELFPAPCRGDGSRWVQMRPDGFGMALEPETRH